MNDLNKSHDSAMFNSVYKFFYDENKNDKVVPPDISKVISSLVETGWLDKDDMVRESVSTSLLQLSNQYSQLILQSIITFRKSHNKLNPRQVHSLLKLVELICQKSPGDILPPILNEVIEFTLEELMKTPQDPVPASAILVALAQNHCNNVMECIQPKMIGESLPNLSIVYTLGHLSSVSEFMPFIKTTLDQALTMLPLVKTDEYRCAFAYSLGRISEAISEYFSSSNDSSSVSKETYSSQLAVAFNCLFTFWMNTKDNKVCEAVLVAISSMFNLLPEPVLNNSVTPLITSLLQLYRRAPALPRHCVTSCLASLLHVAPEHTVEPHIDQIICVLHPMIWAVVDYDTNHPMSFKNHNEALRCYGEMCTNFSSHLDEILIRHLSSGTEQDKIITLVICTHLLSSSGTMLKELIPAVHLLVNDPSVKLRKALVKVIVELAFRKFLTGTDSILIEFLVKNCSAQEEGADWLDLQETCQKTVYALCSTVEVVKPLMWNVLLRMLVLPGLPTAIPTITKSLAHLSSQYNGKRGEVDEGIERSKQVNSKAVIARCLCLLGSPLDCNRGPHLLEFLKNYTSTIDETLTSLVVEKIPSLIDYLKLSEWDDEEWEHMLLDLTHIIVSTMDKDWTMSFASQLSVQFYMCPEELKSERAALMYCLSVTLCLVEDKAIIQSHLDTILNTLRTNTSVVPKTCGKAVGIVARRHLELVMNRLETTVKSELSKKSSRLLGLLRDTRQEIEAEKARLTLLLCYVFIVSEAPPNELVQHLTNICQFLISQLTLCKSEGKMQEVCLLAIENTLQSILQNPIILSNGNEFKPQFLTLTLSQLQNVTSLPKPILLKVLCSLLKLSPSLPLLESSNLLKLSISKVLQYCADSNAAKQSTLNTLWSLIEVVLNDHASSILLKEVIDYLNEWINHEDITLRSHALTTLHNSLVAFHSTISFHLTDSTNLSFIGRVIGIMCARACETDQSVRLPAVRCIHTLLQLALCYEGHMSPDAELQYVFTSMSNDVLTNVNNLSNIVCAKLPYVQLQDYAISLIDGTQDKVSSSAEGSAKLLTLVSESKGPELYHHVNDIQEKIFLHLTSTSGKLLVPVFLALARHHPTIIINGLLSQTLPYSGNLSTIWHELAQCYSGNDTIRHLLRCLGGHLFIEGKHKGNIATHQSLAAVSALNEIFKESSIQSVLSLYFPELLSTLLMVLGAYIGAQPPAHTSNKTSSARYIPNRNVMKLVPSLEVYKALKSLLLSIECKNGASSIQNFKDLEFNNKIDVVIPCISPLVKSLCEHLNSSSIAKIITHINAITCKTESQKILAASIRAAYISNGTILDSVLLDSVLDSVLDSLGYSEPKVLVCSYKALASFAYLDHQQYGRHKDAVLEALMKGIERYDFEHQNVALEAMSGLGLLIPQLPQNRLASIIIPLAITIKPFFEKENVDLRCKALQIFGQLTTFQISSEKESLREQFISNLVCFVLHINEPNPELSNTYRATLYQSIQLLNNEEAINTMKTYITEDLHNNPIQYYNLLKDLSEFLVLTVPDSIHTLMMTSLNYSKTNQALVRANAALFIGLLFNAWQQNDSSISEVTSRLIILLKDSDSNVRMKSAQALSLLYTSCVPEVTMGTEETMNDDDKTVTPEGTMAIEDIIPKEGTKAIEDVVEIEELVTKTTQISSEEESVIKSKEIEIPEAIKDVNTSEDEPLEIQDEIDETKENV